MVGWHNTVAHLVSRSLEGLHPLSLAAMGNLIMGAETNKLRLQNRQQYHALQDQQLLTSMRTAHMGTSNLPAAQARPITYRNKMCPTGIAMPHPAADLLSEWSHLGCPTKTGQPWSKQEMGEAVEQEPHQSSLSPKAIAHFTEESVKKVKGGKAKLILWDDIKDDPPPWRKISPIAAIPHKLKAFHSILDLSFHLWLKHGGFLDSVINSTVKMAPQGALDQLGHTLSRIIHAFAKAEYKAKIFMAKWDVKDGFWWMDCEVGKEYNFAYVLPQEEGKPITLVIPMCLQMGWVEFPPYFCAATETTRDITADYCNTPIESLPPHKFVHHVVGDMAFDTLLATSFGQIWMHLLTI
jgi:hypothetical protein